MNINNIQIDARSKTFTADLDAGPGYDAALAALNLAPNYGYVLTVQGDLYIVSADEGASVELDGDAFLIHPETKATISFTKANLDTATLEEALFEAGYNNADVQQEYNEILIAANEAAWESYNER